MIKKARLIYNPSSGREEIKRRLPQILQHLDMHGIETTCHATLRSGDAEQCAKAAIEHGYDLIIAAGGDGTLYEVINGMAKIDDPPPLGILPLGTTNDFARALKIPKEWKKACDLIIANHTKRIDLGKADERYFINVAGGGTITELSYEVPSKLKTMLGQLAYYIKGLEKVTRLTPCHLHIRAEGFGEFEEDFMLFLIANTHSIGGFDKITPDAQCNDGLFDVLLLRKCNLAEFIRVATLVLRGEHLRDPLIVHFRTSSLHVRSSSAVQINLDGELGGELPCHFSVSPAHIKIFTNGS